MASNISAIHFHPRMILNTIHDLRYYGNVLDFAGKKKECEKFVLRV